MSTKAFELVPALDKSSFCSALRLPASQQVEISAFDCCTRNLFVGTTHGALVHYSIDEKKHGEKISYITHLQGKKVISKKPIQKLKYSSSIDRLVVLTDHTLLVLDMTKFDLSHSHDKFKNVQTFAVNEQTDSSNPFSIKICVASNKKHIQLYNLTAEKWLHIRDIAVPELPLLLSLDGSTVCLAIQTRYILINTETARFLDLFPYEPQQDSPFVRRVDTGEFVLGGPSDLGMFVTSFGMSQRPPIQLKMSTFSLAFSSPYMVSLTPEFLAIHNVLDQQQKQAIPFQGGLALNELGDRILVASSHDVYALVPVPWQKQVDALLSDRRIEEALTLAEASARTSGLSQKQFFEVYKVMQQKAGFVELSQLHFDSAKKFFISGAVDPREVVSLFPGMISQSSEFSRSRPPLHEFADVNQITRGNLNKMEDCKNFLARFLEDYRYQYLHKKDVHTALVKIYAENRPSDLVALLEKGYHGYPDDIVETLETFGRFHALAMYYQQSKQSDKALDIWSKLLNNQLEDESFDTLGLPYFTDVLSRTDNASLVFNYAPVVLHKDPTIGAQIFIKRYDSKVTHEDKRLKPDAVVEFLVRFPEALCLYLEHLILTGGEEKEAYHSHLAMVYVDMLLEAKKSDNQEAITLVREKLQNYLRDYDKYSVNLILGRVERDEWLYPEAAILHGKAGNDKAALQILVDNLKDYKAAEDYCIRQSETKSTATERQQLFEILLVLYLERSKYDDSMRLPVIDLLNNPKTSFNAAKVAEMIPEDWSVALLSQFLLNSVRSSLHDGRAARVSSQLALREYLLANKELLDVQSTRISLTDNRRCDICRQLFRDCAFTYLPNGTIAHIKCAKV